MTQGFSGKGSQLRRTGVLVAEIVNIDGPDGKQEFDDATSMDSPGNTKEWIPTLIDWGSLSFTGIFRGMTDASQSQLVDDFNNQTLADWTVTFPGGRGGYAFNAYVEQFSLKAAHDKKVDFSAKLKVSGQVDIT